MEADLKVYVTGGYKGWVTFETLMDNITHTMDSMKEYVDNAHAEIERLEDMETYLNGALFNSEDVISELKDDIKSLNDEIRDLKNK